MGTLTGESVKVGAAELGKWLGALETGDSLGTKLGERLGLLGKFFLPGYRTQVKKNFTLV